MSHLKDKKFLLFIRAIFCINFYFLSSIMPGLFNHSLMRSTALQPAELSSAKWTHSKFMAGGLRSLLRRDPFDEAKAGEETSEKASISSQPPTPLTTPETAVQPPIGGSGNAEGSHQDTAMDNSRDKTNGGAVLDCLAGGLLVDPRLKVLLSLNARYCRENNLVFPMNFPTDHPVEEAGRILLALLFKYQGMEEFIAKLIDSEIENRISNHTKAPKPIVECLKAVHQAKWKLVKIKQEQGRILLGSY